MVANYAAFYGGNFLASLAALEAVLQQRGVLVSYVFPKNAPFSNWDADGKYEERHSIYTTDFKPKELAETLKLISRENSGQNRTIMHIHFLDWKGIRVVTRELRHENCQLIFQEHMRADFGREQPNRSFLRKSKDFLKKHIYKHATAGHRLIGVSDAVYRDLCEVRGTRDTYMVRNAVSTDRLDGIGQWENVLSLNSMTDVVIFGTHFDRKGVDIALHAIMQSKPQLRLVVLTHREKETEELLNEVSTEWQKFAVVRHVVQDVACVYNHALCFISPSRSEAFGYAVVEAAYCNTQVIASDVPGQNSMKCIPGIQWVQPEQIEELADALAGCYELRRDHLDELKQQKKLQRAYIQENFGLEKWCSEILQVYGM